MTARVICCGCQKDMGVKEGFSEPGLVTSTLCPECERKAYAELARMVLLGKARLVT
jgi:hypothetical protein